MATNTGTYLQNDRLADSQLPTLVRRQRRLEAQLVPLKALEIDEKAARADIDVLLLLAGLKKGDVVTCNGYDVKHNERDGQASINQDKLVELLVAGGVDREFAQKCLADAVERGDPAKFATVKPSKGAKVRK